MELFGGGNKDALNGILLTYFIIVGESDEGC